MKTEQWKTNLAQVTWQRNLLAALTLLLSITAVANGAAILLKNERTIVSPPTVEAAFWVDNHGVSPSYLRQWGLFLGQQLFSKSAKSAPMQRTVLTRYTSPDFLGTLQAKLLTEEQQLRKDQASYVFFSTKVSVNPDHLTVLLCGDREFFVAGKLVSRKEESYLLRFILSGGHLLLTGVEEASNE